MKLMFYSKLVFICLLFAASQLFAQGQASNVSNTNSTKKQNIILGKYSYEISGYVFQDLNLNGLKEGYDKGVGGVSIKLPTGKNILSDRNGFFIAKFSTDDNFITINVIQKSIPPGSKLTTPSEFALSQETGRVRKFNFGLKYNKVEKTLSESLAPVESNLNFDSSKLKFHLSFKDNMFFLDGKAIYTLPTSGDNKRSKYLVNFDKKAYTINRPDFEKHLNLLKRLKKNLNIEVSLSKENRKNYDSKLLTLTNDIKIALIELGITSEQYTIKTNNAKDEVFFSVTGGQASSKCEIVVSSKEIHAIKDGQYISLNKVLLPNVKAKILCNENTYFFTMPIAEVEENISQDNKLTNIFNSKPKNQIQENQILIKQAQYLNESQDLNVFFEGKSVLPNLTLMGSEINKESRFSKGTFSFNISAKRGLNTIKFKTTDGQNIGKLYNHSFYVFKEPTWRIYALWGQSYKTSKTSNFSANYKFTELPKLTTGLYYFYKNDTAIHSELNIDIFSPETLSLGSDVINKRHIDFKLHWGKKWSKEYANYFSRKSALYFGIIYKSFDLGDQAVLNFPIDILGPHIRYEIINDEFLKSTLDFKTIFEAGIHYNPSDGHLLKFTQEINIWLNSFGTALNKNTHYSYYTRSEYLHEMRLVTGLSVEYLNAKTSNANNSKTTDVSTSLNLGLRYNF